ncbi:MAG: response regulator [Deltaproteobacteria bacterium]|nr:response regulator [Deltaproteobacteria bacterium]
MRSKVLVVDDSLATARQLTRMIDSFAGYEVVGHARDGLEGIQLFKQLGPDVVLMDIAMPRMDGLESLRTVMSLKPEAKVVMVSAMGGVGRKVEEAIRLGARNVISKPFEPSRVQGILDTLTRQGGDKEPG